MEHFLGVCGDQDWSLGRHVVDRLPNVRLSSLLHVTLIHDIKLDHAVESSRGQHELVAHVEGAHIFTSMLVLANVNGLLAAIDIPPFYGSI